MDKNNGNQVSPQLPLEDAALSAEASSVEPSPAGGSRVRQRSKDSPLRFALEELRFIRSFNDLKNFGDKVSYLLPRVLGTVDRYRPLPPSLQLEPTNYCNARCISCPITRSRRPKGRMEMDLFRKIIADATAERITRVRLFLHGEPFLHPQFIDMIAYLKENGCSVHVTTNGILCDRETITEILSCGVNSADHFTFSIHGWSREVHESITGAGNYYRVTQNIFDFLALRREMKMNGPVIETIFYSMPENAHEEQLYLRFWGSIVDHARLGGSVSESFFEYKRRKEPAATRRSTCLNLWDKMTILWNGDVTICNEDVDGDYVLGNLRESSIRELWNCKAITDLREIHRTGQFSKFPFCHQCDM